MDVLNAVLLVSVGVLAGLLIFDMATRRQLAAKLTKTDADMKEVLAKVQEVHNDLAKQVLACQDQLAAHEFRLTGAGRQSGATRSAFQNAPGSP